MISLQKIIKAMETQPKTPDKRGEIVDLQISPPEVQIEDLQISSPEIQIEDLQMSSPEIQTEDLSENSFCERKLCRNQQNRSTKSKIRNSHWSKISYKKAVKMKTRRQDSYRSKYYFK